jgi:hypothetical protein
MENLRYLKFTLPLLFFLTACQSNKLTNHKKQDLISYYEKAIKDTEEIKDQSVYRKLVPINDHNKKLVWKTIGGEKHLLMVAWKHNATHFLPYIDSTSFNTAGYPIWGTTAPELLNRLKKEKSDEPTLRPKRLLGLPPHLDYNYFIEFWVRPSDLFRPCADNEIYDRKCTTCLPDETDPSHTTWMVSNITERNKQTDLLNKYPWTQLGYTYDWNPNNRKHIGLSEYVIKTNRNIKVKAVYTTSEYFRKMETRSRIRSAATNVSIVP